MNNFYAVNYIRETNDGRYKFILKFIKDEFKLSGYNEITLALLENLDSDFFDKLIKSYIEQPKINSKIRGFNFITFLNNFFDDIREQYGTTNQLLNNKTDWQVFYERQKEYINNSTKLANTKDVQILSDTDCKKLILEIERYILNIDMNIKKINSQINDKTNNISTNTPSYNKFISVIMCQILFEFGFTNKIIESINLAQLSLDEQEITIKTKKGEELLLKMSDKLNKLIQYYINIREKININSSNFLFLTSFGDEFSTANGYLANEKAWIILSKLFGHHQSKNVANRRIYDMLDSHIDISTISKITGRTTNYCLKIQNIYNDEKNLSDIIFSPNDTTAISFETKMVCPVCRNIITSNSDDWVLIEDEQGIKTLACSKCKGGIK